MLLGLLGNKAMIVPTRDTRIGITSSRILELVLTRDWTAKLIVECPKADPGSLFEHSLELVERFYRKLLLLCPLPDEILKLFQF